MDEIPATYADLFPESIASEMARLAQQQNPSLVELAHVRLNYLIDSRCEAPETPYVPDTTRPIGKNFLYLGAFVGGVIVELYANGPSFWAFCFSFGAGIEIADIVKRVRHNRQKNSPELNDQAKRFMYGRYIQQGMAAQHA